MTLNQSYAQTDPADLHGGPVDACVRADRTTAHQEENSHARIRLREIAPHHASPGMFAVLLESGNIPRGIS